MVNKDGARLRLLVAEVRAEMGRIERTVSEIIDIRQQITKPGTPRIFLYGSAALLETFYSGIEKALTRIAGTIGGLPEGHAWHRRLLEDSTLNLPKLRPPILSESTIKFLEPYLAFRHRFRNLYLFDLDAKLVAPLLDTVDVAWKSTSRDLSAFADTLTELADELES
jgi:hypothetical protein